LVVLIRELLGKLINHLHKQIFLINCFFDDVKSTILLRELNAVTHGIHKTSDQKIHTGLILEFNQSNLLVISSLILRCTTEYLRVDLFKVRYDALLYILGEEVQHILDILIIGETFQI